MDESNAALMPLMVARAAPLARGIQALELHAADDSELPAFTPGAHVTVATPSGVLRKYSLCNDCDERDRYVIAVKRETSGRGGSASLVDGCVEGTIVPCSEPRNDFVLAPKARGFLFVAGGIGITPIMAMVRYLATSDGTRPFKLHYLTRSPDETAFLEDLSAPPFAGQSFSITTAAILRCAFDLWPLFERPQPVHVYACGPRPMLQAIRDMSGHWPLSAIHIESFADAARLPSPTIIRFASGSLGRVQRWTSVRDQSILDAMRAHGLDVPSSCESGTCGTCRTRLLEGVADHRDLVLSDAEQADSIMVCVSRARTPELVLDA